MQTVVVGDAY